MSDLLDAEILDALDALEGSRFEGDVWRVTWASRDPLAGNSAGGRWSPDGRFEALYTSLEANGAMAEVYNHLARAPVMSSSHMRLNRLSVTLVSALNLGTSELASLGIEEPLSARLNPERSQAIGEAARMLGHQGLVVPSARWECNNLVLFIDQDRFDVSEHIELLDSSDINWPAWKEAVADDKITRSSRCRSRLQEHNVRSCRIRGKRLRGEQGLFSEGARTAWRSYRFGGAAWR